MRWKIMPSAAAAAAVLFATSGAAYQSASTRLTTALTGEEEVEPGDPDGSGSVTIRVNSRAGRLCYVLQVRGIEPATAAHVHEAPPGVAGPVVVELDAPTSGRSAGCVKIARELAADIVANPEDYYVNVHNEPYPGGALRGQLG